jgi:hypothetical protein
VCIELAEQIARKHPKSDFAIKFDGTALQAEGITRNKRVPAFALRGETLADALTHLARAANPEPAVLDLTSDRQKLVWVIAPDPADAKRTVVLFTTRRAAAKKLYPLAAPFVKP